MKIQHFFCLSILYLAFAACSDIKYREPLPHGATELYSLPDALLGKYEVQTPDVIKSLLYIVQVSENRWALMEQPFILKRDVNGLTYRVENDSLWEWENNQWNFRSKCYLVDNRFECESIQPAYTFDLGGRRFWEGRNHDEPKPLDVRRQGKVYYFNVQEDGFSLYALEPNALGLRLYYLSDLKVDGQKLPFPVETLVTAGAGSKADTTYRANPTNAELARMMRDTSLYKFEDLIRVRD